MNFDCSAYKQRICFNLGMGEFNINSEISQDNQRNCVVCDSILGKICRIGYAHCIIAYQITLPDGTIRDVADRIKTYTESRFKTIPNMIKISKYA